MNMFALGGTFAVVTGAGRGIGLAIANGLFDAGAQVIGVDQKFEIETPFIQKTGDVTSKETIGRVVDEINFGKWSHLVLVNNAGITLPHEQPYPEDLWRKTLEVNLTAPFLWIEAFIEHFRVIKSGVIINITSLGAELAFPNNPSYMASKGGLKMLTKFYARALGKDGVRVNNVGPGYMITEMTQSNYENPAIRDARERHTFVGRWGAPDDLAGACIFLASPAASYITGQDIYVDGGWTANGLVL